MKLTPIDIQQQQFRTALAGFDKKEVDSFLDLVANAFEDLLRDNNNLRDEMGRKETQLDEHRERERNLRETMITATRIAEEVKQGARKESEIIISQAELQAEQIIQNAHTRLVRIMEDIEELKRQKAQFEANLAAMIGAHHRLLEAVSDPRSPMADAEVNSAARRALDHSARSARPVLASVSVQKDSAGRDASDG